MATEVLRQTLILAPEVVSVLDFVDDTTNSGCLVTF